jgi:rubredoxin
MSGNTYRKFQCGTCGHIYDEALGDADGGLAPGTLFEQIPDGWICPECGSAKADFVLYEE